jgi:hypothetical protein
MEPEGAAHGDTQKDNAVNHTTIADIKKYNI